METPQMPFLPALQTLPAAEWHVTAGAIFWVLLLLFTVWLILRYATQMLDTWSLRSTRARFLFKLLQPVMRLALWTVAVFISINILVPSREAFLAALASLGVALALGAQDLVKNLVGCIVILTDRPYQLGDRVKIGEAYGEIDHIGLRSTKLTTPDDTRVTIPNSSILSDQVYNANSGVPDCQVVTDVLLPADTDPNAVIPIGYEAAYTSPYTYLAKPVVVLVTDMFDQRPYLRLRIKAYVYDHRFEPRMMSDITMRAKTELLARGFLKPWAAA
jgi:MscS family membrane protein